MAVYYLQDCKLYVAEHDLSGDTSSGSLQHTVAELDATTFGNGSRVRIAGIEDVALSYEGLWDGDTVGSSVYDEIGGSESAVTLCPTDGTEGEAGFIFKAPHFSYAPGGQVGELYKFSASASGSTRLVRGTVMADASAAVSATGNGTARQLGTVGAGQKVYASLHVIASSGSPTLDVTVESDTSSGMSTPATQLTFTQATGATSEFLSAAGAITDDWWRVDYTFGGTGTITFIVTVGIR